MLELNDLPDKSIEINSMQTYAMKKMALSVSMMLDLGHAPPFKGIWGDSQIYMSLSMCSPWFGGHSVQWFECVDTPNPGSRKKSGSHISDGESC